jgi:hypothetical protein
MSYQTVNVSLGPDAGTFESVKHASIGSLDCMGDTEILKTFRGSRITAGGVTVNQNISATFDPANLKCVICENPHYILSKGLDESPPIIIFSDQNFVSTLSGGKSCIAIVRLEDASIPELVELSLEMLDRHRPPAGTLLIYGSVSHLFHAGTTIYSQDWCCLVNRLNTLYPELRILPLVPIIREDCPGVVSRQLIELSTWFKQVYNKDTLGLASTWDNLISVLGRTYEDGLDLGYNEHYSVAMPSELFPGAPLKNFKFRSNSSHTTTPGMDSAASYELLSSLVSLLKCTFATYANVEDLFSNEPAQQESMLETKTIHVFGASNMRQIIPELEKHGYPVVDHTIPGWMPTPANISALSDSLSKLDKDSIVITDLLGNYAYRYSQMDGTLALPFKSDGKYHFEGNVHMLTMTNLKLVIENLKPALGKCNCHLIFSPPLPRHLHSRCCASLDHCTNVDSEKHAETMLGELNGIRTACIANLELVGIKNFSVPDIVKLSMPACTGIPEYAAALKDLMGKDGVHFTEAGYKCLASGLSSHVNTVLKTNTASVPTISGSSAGTRARGSKQSFYWRGFVSPVGTCRPKNHQQAYLQSHSGPNFIAGRRSTGPIRAVPASEKSAKFAHGRTPYRGHNKKL